MPTFRDLLKQTKAEIREIEPAEADERRRQPDVVLLDVREAEEFEEGAVPGAVFVPRGHLESQVEGRIPDKSTPVVVYCAGGVRSAFAAKTLEELGYTDVVSMAGGFGRWKDEGRDWKTPQTLTPDQKNRYKRHLLLPEVGVEGQQKLLDARVLLLGAGGLGSPSALYLAAAGVGQLLVADDDVVDRSNLQRQVLHTEDRIGQPKVESARQAVNALNPRVQVQAERVRVTDQTVDALVQAADVVVDGADNFPVRYVLNAACLRHRKPLVYGAVHRFEGQVSVFDAGRRRGEAPCYRCLFPEPPAAEDAPNCAEAGVLGVLPGVIGLLQATETIKLLLGIGEPLSGRLLHFDALAMRFRETRLRADPRCPGCGPEAA